MVKMIHAYGDFSMKRGSTMTSRNFMCCTVLSKCRIYAFYEKSHLSAKIAIKFDLF